MKDTSLKWFATRAIREKSYVLRYLEHEGIRHEGISDIRTLLFIHCTSEFIHRVKYDLYDRLLIYRDAERHEPQPIPERDIKTLLLMAPYHDEPVMYLPVDDANFFVGQRKRVTKGIFAGCEGVIKRIKGERRLIVKVSDRGAIATPYIPKDYLEDVL